MAGCRRGDLKWAVIIVQNSSTAQPPQDVNVKEADKPHVTQTLLMRAGDVESNPGPKRKHSSLSEKEEDFNDILTNVARRIPNNRNIYILGKALGFIRADIDRYIATNYRGPCVNYEGTTYMLLDWRDTQTEATERQALEAALRLTGLVSLADLPSKIPEFQRLQPPKVQKLQTLKVQKLQAPKVQKLQAPKVQKLQAPKVQKLQALKVQKLQTPKVQKLQAPKVQKLQAPKVQKLQAPKVQKLQAPKVQKLQAPKVQKLQAPKVQKLQTPKVQIQTASDDLPQHGLLESIVKDIKKHYLLDMCTIQADPTNNDMMFEFNSIYTNPKLFEEDRNNKVIKKALLYCNLLKTKSNGHLPNRLLVQAEGGAGKTTLCAKIAWDWVHGLGFQQFKLVALIHLNKAKNKTVGEVIKSYLSDNNPVTAGEIDNYILSNPKYVLLVFDGLEELRGKFSDLHQIVQIILNRLFVSGTVLVTSRQWMAHEIRSVTELKKVYAFIYIEGFSFDNVTAYIKKFFNQDAASSQELIDFITRNDIIAENMAPYPIFIAMLCIMWREYDGERREAMSKLKTFSQLFDEMFDFLVDHCGSKDDSQTVPTVQEFRQMIPNHLKAIGEIAFQGILDRRREFTEDTFESCRESMEMGFKVGVLTRERHATSRCDRRKNTRLQMFMVQFSHKLFKEFMAAKFLASLYSSDHDRYERIMANILENKFEFRYLLYFTSAGGSELGLDIVTRLISQETTHSTRIIMNEVYTNTRHSDKASSLPMNTGNYLEFKESLLHETFQERNEHFLVDVAYESQYQLVARKVGNQLKRSRQTLKITQSWSAHTVSGFLFIKDHLDEVLNSKLLPSTATSTTASTPDLIYEEDFIRPSGQVTSHADTQQQPSTTIASTTTTTASTTSRYSTPTPTDNFSSGTGGKMEQFMDIQSHLMQHFIRPNTDRMKEAFIEYIRETAYDINPTLWEYLHRDIMKTVLMYKERDTELKTGQHHAATATAPYGSSATLEIHGGVRMLTGEIAKLKIAPVEL